MLVGQHGSLGAFLLVVCTYFWCSSALECVSHGCNPLGASCSILGNPWGISEVVKTILIWCLIFDSIFFFLAILQFFFPRDKLILKHHHKNNTHTQKNNPKTPQETRARHSAEMIPATTLALLLIPVPLRKFVLLDTCFSV